MTASKKALFSLILISITLLLLEVCAYMAISVIEPMEGEKYIFHPLRHHSNHKSGYIFNKDHRTDEYGYPEVVPHVDKPVLEIVLTGASSLRTVSPFTGVEHTIPSLLQQRINQDFDTPIRVRSLATGSYNSFNELMTVYEYLEDLHLQADLVISVNGLIPVNRFEKVVRSGNPYELYDAEASARVNALLRGDSAILLPTIVQILKTSDSNLIRLLIYLTEPSNDRSIEERVQRKADQIASFSDDEKEAAYAHMLRRELINLHMMHELVTRHGAGFAFALLPTAYTWKTPAEISRFPAEETLTAFRKTWQDRLHADYLAVLKEFPVLDLRQSIAAISMENNPFPEDDYEHYNQQATSLIADDLYELVKPMISAKLAE